MLNSTIVLGIGNEFRGDDAVGIHFARQIKALKLPDVTVLESFGEGSELMELWEGADRLFICDAVCSGENPGTIYILEPHTGVVPSKFFNYSTHAFSLAEAVEMSRILGKLPKQMIIYGIEGRSFTVGKKLTATVEASLATVIIKVKEAIIR